MSEPRAESTLHYECHAPESLFTDEWESTTDPQDIKIMINQGGIPCEGGGVPGGWCTRCHWGEYEDVD